MQTIFVSGRRRLVRGAAVGLLAGTLLAAPSLATGTVVGTVLDGRNGQPIVDATVTFEGTDQASQSDLDGLVRAQLGAGTYVAKVSKEGFETQRVIDIVVAKGDLADFAVVLMPSGDGPLTEGAISEEVTVTAEAIASTESALLAERKGAAQISDSIGSQEISKNTGSDAAGALKRVTGISLQDNKYVYVRGLGDRYSNTSLDGSKIPSTEFEKKVVPLDLFPADLLEKITVSKSYTVDKPGDFGAGMVELLTRDFPSRRAAAIGFSFGNNSNTTGEPYLEYGSGLSFSGGGGQSLPGSIPDEPLVRFSPITGEGFTTEELEGFGEDLIGLWTPQQSSSAPWNQSFKGSYGTTTGRVGLVFGATYENDYGSREEERNFYTVANGELVPRNTFDFDYTDEKVRRALNGSVAVRLANNHNLSLRGLGTTLSTAESRFQEGFFEDISANIHNYRLSYQEQQILNLQLSGDHYLEGGFADASLLEWRLTTSDAQTDENRRETLYEEILGEYRLTDNAQSGFMYYNDLDDDLLDGNVHWTNTLAGDNGFLGNIKLGGAYSDADRGFAGRRLRYAHRNTFGLDLTLPAEELFTEELIGPNFVLQDITRPTDTYDGEQTVGAAYAQADLDWGRWRFIGGVRYEDSDIEVVTLDRFQLGNPPVVSTVLNEDLLPSAALIYQLSDRTNLRFSGSRTVNRPEFRELAPFEFIHIAGGYTVVGNPDLVQATITSADVRWEWFPSGGEVVAASVFYKDFEDPIEELLLSGATLTQTFGNAEGAENLGFELELRRRLGIITPKLDDFTAILNYTWVDSEVQLDPESSAFTNSQRPLVGQPDNLVNFILEWNRVESDSTVRLLYNFVDDRVAQGGGFGQADVFEEARTTIDFVYRQGLGRLVDGLALKLSGENLTDEDWHWTQDGLTFRRFEPGRDVSISLTYDFF